MRALIRASLTVLTVVVACKSDPLPIIVADGGTPPLGDAGGGGLPDVGTPQYDAGVGLDAGGGIDRPPPVPPNGSVRITGAVLKIDEYLQGNRVAAGDVTINPLGATTLPVTTDMEGAYQIDLPQNGWVIFEAVKTNYRKTYEEYIVGNTNVDNKNLYLASETYVTNVATTYGVDLTASFACHAPNQTTEQCRYGILLGRIVDDGSEQNGTPAPLAGIAKADFTIKYHGDATWYKKGPYFLGPTGAPDTAYTTSQRETNPATGLYRGGLFVTFLEMPLVGPTGRAFEISINSAAGGTTRIFGPVTAQIVREGFTWKTVPQTGEVAPPPPPPVMNVDFDTQVYPMFLEVNQGGYGCLGCHTDQGGATPAGGMNLYGGPAAAYAKLDPASYPQRVNLANPSASYLLVRPLYEDTGVQDHPIFAWASVDDPGYKIVYQWISEGAQRNNVVVQPISFANQVRPILYNDAANGGAGCRACHYDGVNRNNAPGNFYMGGTPADLYAALTQETPTDNGQTGEPYRINKAGYPALSLVLLNPLYGSAEPHPAKLFTDVNDPRYQTIYTWIQQGYVNDAP